MVAEEQHHGDGEDEIDRDQDVRDDHIAGGIEPAQPQSEKGGNGEKDARGGEPALNAPPLLRRSRGAALHELFLTT